MLGEFPDQGEDTLIPLSGIEAAVNRDMAPPADEDSVVLAVDVARFGSDKSVILRRRGVVVEEVHALPGLDTMKLTGHIVNVIDTCKPDEVVVDEVGIGAGVVDRLREQGYSVSGVNVGGVARDSEHFANLRAEGYWNLRQLLLDGSLSLPSDNELVGQLAGLRYTFNSTGKVLIESKEEMRRRGTPSPDKADALMLAFSAHKRRVKLWR